jgi:4-amino-4-deoxy-L-arabinose transferase-like glycosyltransferase
LDDSGSVLILAVAAAALVLYLYRAGAMPLTDPDEGRYAEIARQMAVSDDWLVPRLFGMPFLEKPPLFYWLAAATFRLFGVSELSARLVPALSAALGVAAVGWFARLFLSPSAGILGAIVLALSALYLVIARTVLVDMLFSATLAAALFAFFAYREAPVRSVRLALAFWASLAFATLSKGPVAIVLCGLTLAIDAALGRSWKRSFDRLLVASSLVFFCLALPWFALIEARYPTYLSFYVWKEHLQRAAGAEHSAPFYWFVPWLLGGLMPWTPLAVVAAPTWWTLSCARSLEGRATRFLLVWAATVFVFFSAAGGKLATYIVPMFPPIAVLLGAFLERVLRGTVRRESLAPAWAATGILLVCSGVLVLAGSVTFGRTVGPGTGALIASPLLAGGIAVFRFRVAPQPGRPFVAMVIATVALYAVLAHAAASLATPLTAKPLIDRVARETNPRAVYALWGKYLPSAAFYLDRPPLLVGTRPELRFGKSLVGESANVVVDLAELGRRTAGQRLYVFTDNRSKREQELRAALGDVALVARDYDGALWVRVSSEPHHALTQGSSK